MASASSSSPASAVPPKQLHIFFFPLMAPGHILPSAHMAVLFAARGVRCTVLTTPGNASLLRRAIDRAAGSGLPVDSLLLQFSPDAGIPEGQDSLVHVTTIEEFARFVGALGSLREPFRRLLREHSPDCVVSDMFVPWTAEDAGEYGVPRLVFPGMGFFPLCVMDGFRRHEEDVRRAALDSGDDGVVLLPGLPHKIGMKRSQLPDSVLVDDEFGDFFRRIAAVDRQSYGALVNSFYELEPDYVEHYRRVVGMRVWHIGPVFLFNRDPDSDDSSPPLADQKKWLTWLDSKETDSVVYVCFGSLCQLTVEQLREIALGLEDSGHPYIWVVRNGSGEEEEEEAIAVAARKGLVIRGWAPQVLLLGHRAVGGFVTHCGWNSVMEAVAAGLPMVTWPLSAEQFYNERLVVDVLRVGVAVGAEEWGMREDAKAVVGRQALSRAVRSVMGGGDEAEAQQMRRRAAELMDKARAGVEEGGSSHADVGRLIEELTKIRSGRK